MIRTIHLHGRAAELYGDSFRIDVDTLAEATQALSVQVPGFRQFLADNDFQCVAGPQREDGFELDEGQLQFRLGRQDLHIMPVFEGSGGKAGGIGKIIAGVLLAGVGFFAAPLAAGGAIFGMSQSTIIAAGLGMAAMGVSMMLSAQPETDKEEEKSDSFSFGNSLGTARQGDVVPWAFGRVFIQQPRIISAGISSSNIAIGR